MITFATLRRALAGPALLALAVAGLGSGCSNDEAEGSGRGLSVSPATLSFVATRGRGLPAAQTLSVSITASDAAYVGAGYPPDVPIPSWLSLSLWSTSDAVAFRVEIATTDLPAGTYTTTLRVGIARLDESIIGYRDIPVTYTVRHAALDASPTGMGFTQTAGCAAPQAQVVWLNAGADSYPWSATVEYTDGSGWLEIEGAATASAANLPVALTVTADATSGMAPGTYEARIHVTGLVGTIDVPVQLELLPPRLTQSTTAMTFEAVAGASPPPAGLPLDVGTEAGAVTYTASVAYDAGPYAGAPDADGWLDVVGSGTAPETVSIVPNTTERLPGRYTATVTLTPSNGAPPIDVDVTYWLTTPLMTVSSTAAVFGAMAGQPSLPAGVRVDVAAQAGTIAYTTHVAYGTGVTGWLDVAASGTAPETVSIAPNTVLLPAGTHTATVTLAPLNGAPDVYVLVTYEVTASQLGLSPGSMAFSVDPATQPLAIARALEITDTGVTLAWTVESSAPWVSVSPGSGVTGAVVSVALDTSVLDELANGAHTATLTFTSSGPSVTNVTRTLSVTLDLALPRIRQVAPYVAYAGREEPVILRGEGFTSLADPTVEFGGVAATAVSLVDDTELRVTPPGTLAPGRHLVVIANGNRLGLARTRAELAVVAVPTHTPGLIVSAGPLRRLIYDAERSCLYGANGTGGAIQRWCDSGTGWTASSLELADVRDVALSHDGAELVAITGSSLHRIDAASLSVVGTSDLFPLGVLGYVDGIVLTNDGNALILTGGTGWRSLYRADPGGAGTATKLSANLSNICTQSTYTTILAASIDGDRVVTGDCGDSPPNHAFTYDATGGTSTLSVVSGVASVSLDRAGGRIGLAGTVYTGDFVSMGQTANIRMTVSANGARAYAYSPATPSEPARLLTYDISGTTVAQVGPAEPLTTDPGSASDAVNLLLTSLDGGTLFVDGPSGILVMPAP